MPAASKLFYGEREAIRRAFEEAAATDYRVRVRCEYGVIVARSPRGTWLAEGRTVPDVMGKLQEAFDGRN